MDNKDIELIQQMENKYDTFMPVLTNLIDSVEKFNSIYNNYIELKNFYGSEKWFEYMEIEKIHVAAEMQSKNEECWQQMHKLFDGKEWIVTDHEHFKQATKTAKAVIRTGETTPFANVILHSGVIF